MFINASPFEIPRRFFPQRILISSSLRASAALGLLPGFALLLKLLVFSFETFSCTFISNVFDDTDGIYSFKCRLKLLNRPLRLKVLMAQFFSRKYLAYHMYIPILKEEKLKKTLTLGYFWVLKCSYFVLKVSRELVTN